MKIILLIDSLGFGGAQRQMANLAVQLKKENDVQMIVYYPDNFYLNKIKDAGINIVSVENKNALDRVYQIRKLLMKEKPELVISFLETPNFIACVSSIGNHTWKLITCERNAKEEQFTSKRSRIYKWFERFSDFTVCNSFAGQALWEKYYPQYKSKLTTIYNIVEEIREETSFNKDKCKVVVAARYQRQKNILGMIEAVEKLPTEYKDKLSIEWYGNIEQDGSTSEEYRPATELIKKYQLQNTVFLHDKTDRIHSIMAKADYVALFSYVEGLPNAILEGMMLSKPIILTRMSDYAVLVDHSNGFLCNADDVQSIKDALMSAIDTSIDERVRMGECSYQKVIMNCSQDSVISSWKKVITDIGVGDKKCT